MNIRLILQDDAGKRFTLPVKGVGSIQWELREEGGGSLTCYGPREAGAAAPLTLVELPAGTVRTVYRDDEKAAPRPRSSRKGGEPQMPPAE